jgi:putative YhbY family RNA-binding protein
MLNPAQRKSLRARAHKLDPVVQIGAKGLTDEVMGEIERALKAHELIKLRAPGLERDARGRVFSLICRKTAAELVQQIGKVLVIFRKNDE